MFRGKKFFNLITLSIIGLVGASVLTYFSFAQNYDELIESNLINRILHFVMPKHDVWLYAVTEPNTYTIHFDGNGSTSGNMNDMGMTYDQKANLIANNFIKDGWSFVGWARSKTGAVEYSDQEEVINLTTEDGGVVTLYAQRETEISYTIEYCQEKLEGPGCDVVETGIGYTTSGVVVILTGNEYPGFTLRTGDVVSVSSGGTVQYYYTRNTYNLTVNDRGTTLLNTGVKYEADILPILPPNPTGWTGNTFSGWEGIPSDNKMPASDLVITGIWNYGQHTITFDTDGGSDIDPITADYGDAITVPNNPTRTGYEFVGWNPELPSTMPYDDITVTAIWKEIDDNKGSGRSGGGGRREGDSSGDSQEDDQHGSATNKPSQGSGNVIIVRPDLEVFIAYIRANKKGIVDASWENADPDGYIPRGDMAEMVVKFTENVLGREIPSVIPSRCSRGDANSEWKSPEIKAYAEKACALGVMGIRMQNFMPNKLIDRAEFGTILSRLLWGDKYDVVDATATKPYYTRHLDALNREGIMKQIENPLARKELRKWAWIMMMRVQF